MAIAQENLELALKWPDYSKKSEEEVSYCEEPEENGEKSLQTLSKNLRDRSNLKKTKRYEDCIMTETDTPDEEAFHKLDDPCDVKTAGTEVLSAGTILAKSGIDGQNNPLSEVWPVPGLSKNLFSVLAAYDKNATVHSVQKASNRRITIQDRNSSKKPKKIVEINATMDSHDRWGHQDRRHVKAKLQKKMRINVTLEKHLCEPCIYEKAHKLPSGNSEKASKPGELVSDDVCRPFDEFFQKKRYVEIFKDSFTKSRRCYLSKEKSETKLYLRDFLQHAKVMGHTVKEYVYSVKEEITESEGEVSDCEKPEEDGEKSLQTLSKNLRDRSNLKKTKRYEDCIMTETDTPDEEAVNEKNSHHWKKAMNQENRITTRK
ncbi:hypothetical protein ILUMI_03728 [Ignelater luminosus]|uniref:Uncharacterized protein n=1 Tax=Ignelater luminosus TaxID=2038154 RepID=A0A8K0GI15_IGNLU|nr:hypothetical protein ILUMI_03728 [Ignelater luminosus]